MFLARVAFRSTCLLCLTGLLFVSGLSGQEIQTASFRLDAETPDKEGQISRINELIERDWKEYGLEPSKDATDGEWCRRLHLDLIGRVPTVKEVQAFVSDRDENRREKLVDKLIESDDYTEEFARNWTTIWTNILIGRTGGTDDDSMINRRGMQKYLCLLYTSPSPRDRG